MSCVDVAKSAGVSVTTVSRVVNNPDSVAPGTVALVKRAMAALNYTPPSPGQRRGPKLKSGRAAAREAGPVRVGLWCIGTPEPQVRAYFSSQLDTLHFALAEAGMELKLLFSTPGEVPPELLDGSLAGFIVQGLSPSAESLRKIAGRPHVWLMTRRGADYPGDYVEPDNAANGRLAANWLAAQGARRWVFLTIEPDYPAYAQRGAAFLARAKELKIPVAAITGTPQDGRHHLTMRPGDDEMDKLASRLLARSLAADGIYMPGDGMCGAFFRAIRGRGGNPSSFRVIMGNYNHHIYDSLHPQPAAIDVNSRAIIRYAVLQLADRIKNPDASAPPVGMKISPFLHK
ncbi:MAG: LacI family DNA-binding transcriptional regulator [Opitutaceae bacterium]|nr:LacI family DNA-binding transcriptional regulator [Opitutaceae bacterium]